MTTLFLTAALGCCAPVPPVDHTCEVPPFQWATNYAATMAAADREDALMVVYLRDEADPRCRQFDEEIESSLAQSCLRGNHCVRLPLDASIVSGGESIQLLEHPAFAGLEGGPGLVVFDFSTRVPAQRGRVFRCLPFRDGQVPRGQDLAFLEKSSAKPPTPVEPFPWLGDYHEATAKAEKERRMLLIYFASRDGSGGCRQFEAQTLSQLAVRERLSSYVCVKLAQDTKVNIAGVETVLLKHPSFSEMIDLPGIAIVDFSDPATPYYADVVSTFPFLRGRPYNPAQMEVILNLPPGKLTQRTLIYAVRTHPDAPQSTSGQLDPFLASEAESHSAYQARIRLQGHHFWERRFQRINGRLPRGLLAAEVCAESWPGECLLEAAIDCVQCWRQSSGHWGKVRAAHPVFGYDIRRGSNGIWYATGIFGKRGP